MLSIGKTSKNTSLFLVITLTVASSFPTASGAGSVGSAFCDSPVFDGEPRGDDGIFEATAVIRCRSGLQQALDTLNRRIHAALNSERELNSPTRRDGPATVWDVTHRFKDEGNPIRIRETVRVDPSHSKIVYLARSSEIEASGTSSYLRKLEVEAIIEDVTGIQFSLKTQLRIERPWFAPAFVFYPIARTETLRKLRIQGLEFARKITHAEGSPLP